MASLVIDEFQNSLPRLGEPVVGKEYTLDEFRGLQPMSNNVVVMGEGDKLDCGLETNLTSKIEPVKVKVRRARRRRGLRSQYEWDKDGNTLFVFCAEDLRRWLTTKVPNYNKMYDTNPFNKKQIFAVQYLTQKEANQEWRKRKIERKMQEEIERMREANKEIDPMVKVLHEQIIWIDSKIQLAKSIEEASDVSKEIEQVKDNIDEWADKIRDKEEDYYNIEKLINAGEKGEEDLKAVEQDLEILNYQINVLAKYYRFILTIIDPDVRKETIKALQEQLESLKKQYERRAGIPVMFLHVDLFPTSEHPVHNSMTQKMFKLKF